MSLKSLTSIALSLTLILLCACSCSTPLQVRTPPPVVISKTVPSLQQAYYSTMAVVGHKNLKMYVKGTAVVLQREAKKPMCLLSAAHVIPKGEFCVLIGEIKRPAMNPGDPQNHDYKNLSIACIKAIDHRNDLVLLQSIDLLKESGPSVQLGSPARIGQSTWSIGNPLGFHRETSHSEIQSIVYSRTKTPYYHTGHAVYPGSSGGGLYDNRGKLIGITVAMRVHVLSLFGVGVIEILRLGNLHIHTQTIEKFLERAGGCSG